MSRRLLYVRSRSEEVVRTFETADDVMTFLWRRLEDMDTPYLPVPYLAYGRTDASGVQEMPPKVLVGPRVYVKPSVRWGGFTLHVEAPAETSFEEHETGWHVSERFEPVDPVPLFELRELSERSRARQGRWDGCEELRIDQCMGGINIIGTDEIWPEYAWLRLSLEDPTRVRDEDTELAHLMMLADL